MVVAIDLERDGKPLVDSDVLATLAAMLRATGLMFAPGLGIRTDEATGSAAIRLTAALGRDLQIEQGAGSMLVTHRRNLGREVEIGGRTTPGRDVELA